MSNKYQFRYQLPAGKAAIDQLLKRLEESLMAQFGAAERDGIQLSLIEGLAFTLMTGVPLQVTLKLAYEPGQRRPCYATYLCSATISGKRLVFPYGGEDTRKANMFFTESPEIRSEHNDIHELIGFHAPFKPEHKVGRYVGTAFERSCIILDVIGHLMLLNVDFKAMGAGPVEFYDWAFRSAGITQEEFQRQLQEAAKGLSMETHINPFLEGADNFAA